MIKKSFNKIYRMLVVIRDFFIIDLTTALKNFIKHDGELTICSLAFYLLISFIPSFLIIFSILSFFYDTETIVAIYQTQLRQQLPTINIENVTSILDTIIYSKRYQAFIWIPFLFWWGSFVFDIIERGLEKAFHIPTTRKYWKAKIRHFVIIFVVGIFFLFLTIFSNALAVIKNSGIVHFIQENLHFIPILGGYLLKIGAVPILLSSAFTLLANSILIFMIYRLVPPKKLNKTSLFKGALIASLSYEFVKILFSYYITQINDYSSIFGSLNTIVILMIWIWYSCFLFIMGAELAWVFFEKGGKIRRNHRRRFWDRFF